MKQFQETALSRSTVSMMFVVAGLTAAALAHAQAGYPDRPIRLVVPFSQGTAVDAVARLLGEGLSQEIGSPVIVDNRLGASGVIGTEAVAKAAPDGYTLLFTSPAHYFNKYLYKSLPYDTVDDFTPVTKISNALLVLVVSKDSPFSSPTEVIEYAKAKPEELRYSSAGLGSTTQLSGALFNAMAGIKVDHVPYKGGAQALTDVMGGHVSMTFTAVATALPHAKAGTLKALGVTGMRRSQSMPEVPTIDESALPGYELVSWSGALAPKGTPDEVVEKLNAAMVKVAEKPEFQARLVAIGVEPDVMPRAVFQRAIDKDLPNWARIAEMSGAVPQ
jgi:tripartite-type tricarboxylate transporter receptor subunit TctC